MPHKLIFKRCTQFKTVGLMVVVLMTCLACTANKNTRTDSAPFITSSQPLRIVSANDGHALSAVWGGASNLPDSITVIDLSPDGPPVTRTVSGTVPNNYAGSPISAIIGGGRYAFIPNHPFATRDDEKQLPSQITVVDLDADDLPVLETITMPDHAWQVMSHPDDERVIAISDHQFHVFNMQQGRPVLIAESEPFAGVFISFAINPAGTAVLVTVADEVSYSTEVELHLFSIEGDEVKHQTQISSNDNAILIDQPFAPRFSPDGSRVLVLNGLGLAIKPPLDALLSIDMTLNPPAVTESISNVAQGLESLAFHPSGQFAVVTCIDGPFIGHLAVVDLAAAKMRILSYIPIEYVPQGIEFSPDGSLLFVQATTANHINVYAVDGMKLIKSPYVLRTGEGPATMALSPLKLTEIIQE